MTYAIDIDVDWNTQDDTGLPWTFVDEATDPSRIVPGAFVIAGRGTAVAVAEVVDVDQDGVVRLHQSLPSVVVSSLSTCPWSLNLTVDSRMTRV